MLYSCKRIQIDLKNVFYRKRRKERQMKKRTKLLVVLSMVTMMMQVPISAYACECNASQGDVSPLCMGVVYICDRHLPGEYVESVTHTYGFLGKYSCVKECYNRTSTARCWYCGAISAKESGYSHPCYMIHRSCDKGTEYVCLADGSLPVDP